MFTEIAERPTASPGLEGQTSLLLPVVSCPVATAAGLSARALDAWLRYAGFTITRHPAGYRLIVLERGSA